MRLKLLIVKTFAGCLLLVWANGSIAVGDVDQALTFGWIGWYPYQIRKKNRPP